jgi:hypothetical protein
MKQKLFIGFLLLTFSLKAQTNLVQNPSFEYYNSCPNYFNQINRATGWNSALPTPDYFNLCASNVYPSFSVPNNIFGYRTAATGNGYSGFIAKEGTNNVREYIGSQLITPLQIGIRYYMSMKVSLAGGANRYNVCGINKLGILFSTVLYDSASPAPICNCAQIYTDSIITDTLNWTRITGSFIADSNYSYINIGNFFSNYLNDSIQIVGTGCNAYYYLDDICVSNDSIYSYTYVYTGGSTGINNLNKVSTACFPNPSKDLVTITDDEKNIEQIKLYDVMGQLLQNYEVSNLQEYKLNLTTLPQGSYTIVIYKKGIVISNYIITKL